MALEIIIRSKPKNAWPTKACAIFAFLCFILGVTIFSFAYVSMQYHVLLYQYNIPVLEWLASHRKDQLTPTIELITSFGGSIYLSSIVASVAVAWVIIKREVWRPALLIGAVSICPIISTTIKSIIHNARPPQEFMIQPFELDYSFPSGHTLGIAVFLLVLGYLIISRHTSDFRVTVWFILTIATTALIAFSRLYLGYHWLTDVTASFGLAYVVLSIVVITDRFFVHIFKN